MCSVGQCLRGSCGHDVANRLFACFSRPGHTKATLQRPLALPNAPGWTRSSKTAMLHPLQAPVVKWISREFPKLLLQVRFLPGAPDIHESGHFFGSALFLVPIRSSAQIGRATADRQGVLKNSNPARKQSRVAHSRYVSFLVLHTSERPSLVGPGTADLE